MDKYTGKHTAWKPSTFLFTLLYINYYVFVNIVVTAHCVGRADLRSAIISTSYPASDAHGFDLSRFAAQLAELVLAKQKLLGDLIIICRQRGHH